MSTEMQLATLAENAAQNAEKFSTFRGLNLLHIRREVSHLLGLIGRDGIFDQYTVHDISHIDKMLNSLTWIIPDKTKEVMSPADWLMTVLSIYFHDMGMLVTAHEYDNRNLTDFPRLRIKRSSVAPRDWTTKKKFSNFPADRAERFLLPRVCTQQTRGASQAMDNRESA